MQVSEALAERVRVRFRRRIQGVGPRVQGPRAPVALQNPVNHPKTPNPKAPFFRGNA